MRRFAMLGVALAVALAGCGGGGQPEHPAKAKAAKPALKVTDDERRKIKGCIDYANRKAEEMGARFEASGVFQSAAEVQSNASMYLSSCFSVNGIDPEAIKARSGLGGGGPQAKVDEVYTVH